MFEDTFCEFSAVVVLKGLGEGGSAILDGVGIGDATFIGHSFSGFLGDEVDEKAIITDRRCDANKYLSRIPQNSIEVNRRTEYLCKPAESGTYCRYTS